MEYLDPVYGPFAISSPVVLELIGSAPLQRLKRIGQYGIPDRYYHKKNFSRFDHCVGVMLVLQSLAASEEEQVAGLLHDASHTAFSHVIDFVVHEVGGDESFQDEHHGTVVLRPPVSDILRRHGYDPEAFLHHERFPLLEQPIPDVCADRIDYAFREFPQPIAQECFRNLRAHDRKIVFATQESAQLFGEHFLRLQTEHWSGLEAMSRYHHFAQALRLALAEGTVAFDDFWQDDDFVVAKLHKARNPLVHRILAALEEKSLVRHPLSATITHKKFRFVDPEFIQGETLVRLSGEDRNFADTIEYARQANREGHAISTLGL